MTLQGLIGDIKILSSTLKYIIYEKIISKINLKLSGNTCFYSCKTLKQEINDFEIICLHFGLTRTDHANLQCL